MRPESWRLASFDTGDFIMSNEELELRFAFGPDEDFEEDEEDDVDDDFEDDEEDDVDDDLEDDEEEYDDEDEE